MKKVVAFIGPLPPPVGGVALANIRVQQILLENKKEYKIINYNTSKNVVQADLYKRKSFGEGWHFVKNIFQLMRFVSKNKIDISNVFVVPNISFIREIIFIFILKISTKKLIVHLHAKTEGDYFLEGFRLKIFTSVISLGDIVFVLSEKFHRRFYSKYIKLEKLVVLENFVDYKEFDNDINEKNGGFLYVGRISEKKGFLTLVEAVIIEKDKLKDLKIDVLGEFENDEFEALVLKLISDEKLNNFVFHGAKIGAEKFDFFKRNSVFVFPSYFENSPIVLKEAIAAKMAIVSSDIIENKNILDPYDIKVYFEAKNAQSLAGGLKQLHLDKSKAQVLMNNTESIKEFDREFARQIIEPIFSALG